MSCHGNVVHGTGTAGKHISNKVQPIPKRDDDDQFTRPISDTDAGAFGKEGKGHF